MFNKIAECEGVILEVQLRSAENNNVCTYRVRRSDNKGSVSVFEYAPGELHSGAPFRAFVQSAGALKWGLMAGYDQAVETFEGPDGSEETPCPEIVIDRLLGNKPPREM